MEYKAHLTENNSPDAVTPINLTNHTYWNLEGHEHQERGMLDHKLLLHAWNVCEKDKDYIPTRRMLTINDHPEYDFTIERDIESALRSLGKSQGLS